MQLSNKSAMLKNKNTSCSNIIINKVSQSNNAIIYTWTCMKLLKLCKKKNIIGFLQVIHTQVSKV